MTKVLVYYNLYHIVSRDEKPSNKIKRAEILIIAAQLHRSCKDTAY